MSTQRVSSLRLACLVLAGAPMISSCVGLVAGAAIGYVVYQEFLPNDVYQSQVVGDVDHVWEVSKETLGFMIDPGTEMTVTESPRVAEGKVSGAEVKIEVEAYDLDRTLIRVHAEKYLASDNGVTRDVMNSIIDRLAR